MNQPRLSISVDPRVMDQIAHLDLLSRCVVDGFLSGKHRSTHKGGCCEFSQHRPYAPGDEIRRIDWQVYARNDRYFVRQFEEETNLQATVALDTSATNVGESVCRSTRTTPARTHRLGNRTARAT